MSIKIMKLDWNEYLETAAQTVAEGIVMLKNENNALPLDKNSETAVFGRIQLHYYKSGTGSGGMVNVSKVTNIVEGLTECGVKVNEELLNVYKKWDEENPFDKGAGWGGEPWCQQEMPLDEKLAEKIAESCDTAVVIIGRTAGEEQDNRLTAGSYFLTELEKDMLSKVCRHFKKTVLLLNVGNIIDMNDINEADPDAVLYVWQGGMTGGTGTARVLTGEVSPCGKLPDTIAYNVNDYPSDKNFGSEDRDVYSEDIFVGYRYFETFAKDRVMYPFGYGLSYTDFDVKTVSAEKNGDTADFEAAVKNTGKYSGKEVVQVYCQAPQGKLGKAARVLCGYEKTEKLAVGESETLKISVRLSDIASYDDSGVTGNKNCFVLEAGEYVFYVGTDVRSAKKALSFELSEDIVISRHAQALAPVVGFDRMKAVCKDGKYEVAYEKVPVSQVNEAKRREENMPAELEYTGDRGIKLADVVKGRNTLDEFTAQLADEDLACIIRGEGMGSPKVTAGTAAAFGGVSKRLGEFGVPCGCCSDGPSGMRLDCGTNAFSLPNGTMTASTFNKKLVTKLFEYMGLEMAANKVDCLLGPGMNIHRHPLNGRNFEYFSEDPFLTGTMACAELKGMHSSGVTGTIKHFCANNQETNRHFLDSVVSERALREIYLKGFELAVKDGGAKTIMTTYGKVNGLWTAGSFDLNTQILRNEWGFKGLTMTDWWANINRRGCEPDKTDLAAMAAAQNDVYMVCADGENNDDNTLSCLESGTLRRCELQRNAENILRVLMETNAMKRIMGQDTSVEVTGKPADEQDVDSDSVEFFDLKGSLELPMEGYVSEKGTYKSFALIVDKPGVYKVTVKASSDQSELAQIPVTIFSVGTPFGTLTFSGTNGEVAEKSLEIPMFSRFISMKMFFAQSGLKLHSVDFELTDKVL